MDPHTQVVRRRDKYSSVVSQRKVWAKNPQHQASPTNIPVVTQNNNVQYLCFVWFDIPHSISKESKDWDNACSVHSYINRFYFYSFVPSLSMLPSNRVLIVSRMWNLKLHFEMTARLYFVRLAAMRHEKSKHQGWYFTEHFQVRRNSSGALKIWFRRIQN